MRLAMAATAALAMTITAFPAASQESPHKPTPLETTAAEGMTHVLRDDCTGALPILRRVYEDDGFSQLEGHLRSAVLEGADLCEARLGHTDEAFALSRRAMQEPTATALAWGLHIDLALGLSRVNDAVTALTSLARHSPAVLADMKEQSIFSAYAMAEALPNADARRLELLEALDKANWRPKDPFNDAAGLKLERVRLLLAAHRDADAKAVAETIADPSSLLALRVDDRYAAVSAKARETNMTDATRQALFNALLLAGKRPEWLSGPAQIARLRMRLGDNEAALRVIQAGLDRFETLGASAFADAEDGLRPLQALKAEVLSRLGRLGAADAAFAEAAAEGGDGAQPVDEKLAYASYLIDTDRSALALDLLKGMKTDTLTDSGKAYVAAMRACAYSVTHDAAAMRRELAIVTAPQIPEYGALVNGLVCAGDFDAVARLYVERLKDPAKRTDALLALQHYRRPPTHGQEDKTWDDDYLRVLSRPEVVEAAHANGGHIETVEIFDPGTI